MKKLLQKYFPRLCNELRQEGADIADFKTRLRLYVNGHLVSFDNISFHKQAKPTFFNRDCVIDLHFKAIAFQPCEPGGVINPKDSLQATMEAMTAIHDASKQGDAITADEARIKFGAPPNNSPISYNDETRKSIFGPHPDSGLTGHFPE